MSLPTSKTPPNLGIESKKLLIAGAPKVGKSTLLANFDAERTLLIATEPGLDAHEVYQVPCRSWDEFRNIGSDLANEDHQFKTVGIDTVDVLAKFCEESVIGDMANTAGMTGFAHASDFGYGKGYKAIESEFQLRIAKLCNLGLGVVFLSHLKESTVKTRAGEITVFSPDVGAKGQREWLLGFVDYIFWATIEDDQRLLRTQPTDLFPVAGGRTLRPMPDPLPLDAAVLREEYEKAMAPDPQPEQLPAAQETPAEPEAKAA